LRILLVDDDEDTLWAVRELLMSSFPGAEVACIADTARAIEVAIDERPDVVVTDLHMPDGGGAPLTVALRRHPRTCTVPIVVVTGHGGAADWHELRRMGADRFLLKPLDVHALAAVIGSLTAAGP
jgi:DNA-binding response OmpR family regulator